MSNYNLFNASTKELYTLVLSVYLVRLSQLYAYSYCTYKIQPKENQPNGIVVRAVITVLATDNFFQCIKTEKKRVRKLCS